ncbi:hypothetical protein [Stutzerimonas stutzeri]|uniref:hypothetical protein n=1 Tax=Stutzerimonas stutzeri TaxID=316 RepID=UPI000F7B9A67|nr:hypothetical protein [Stutzerimonas stutzeri]RRV80383.1 hypothetical protein EGI92_12420 [Stutzerimonas stutzeri]
MSNGHTPGPWSIDKEERWVIHEPEGKSGTLVVPEIYLDDDEAIANARLIAAAPELLAALESAQMALMGYTHQNAVTLAALEKARAAIAKARGTPC